ncbi:hypothetical protein NDU88_005543 [Pleurodeles waltl]|uniref:Uncharacterized protein n=1 Tax=Pleurodeles waltl TaxID=8319 RepID=A0AAV7NVK4_PLEWA|nr:hypothetical protein NDU88_005543 [Pleurodeles waltl]
MPRWITAQREVAASAARPGLRPSSSPKGRFRPRHFPGSPRGPKQARSLPSARPLRTDLDRPGEVLIDHYMVSS